MGRIVEKVKHLLITDVCGPVIDKITGQTDQLKVVGRIEHYHPLNDQTFEVVRLIMVDDYRPASFHQDSVDDVIVNKDPHAELLYPHVWVKKSGKDPMSVMVNGFVQTITGDPNDVRVFEAEVNLDLPDTIPNKINRITIRLPKEINLNSKIVRFVPYDIFFSRFTQSKMEELWMNRSVTPERFHNPSIPVKFTITSGFRQVEKVYFSVNGLPPTRADVNYQHGKLNTTLELTFPGVEDTLQETLSNEEFMEFSETKFFTWRKHGGIRIYLDTDYVRLNDSSSKRVEGIVDENLTKHVENLRISIKENEATIDDLETKLRNKELSTSEVVETLQKQLRQKENTVINLNGKLAEATNEMKKMQEEFKTKREEVRYVSSRYDAEAGLISDNLKVAGAVLGFSALLFTLFKKASAPSVSGMVEWGIPSFSGMSLLTNASAIAVGTKLFINATLIIGGIVLLEKATGIFSAIYHSSPVSEVIEEITANLHNTVDVVCGCISKIIEIASGLATKTKEVIVSTYHSVKDIVVGVCESIGSAVSDCVSSVCNFFSWGW